jgi:hypothetical protein
LNDCDWLKVKLWWGRKEYIEMRMQNHRKLYLTSACVSIINITMWMCYAEESWTRAINKYTAAERLVQKFTALQDDAEHETVYGNGTFSPEYCQVLTRRYQKGSELCQQFIDGKTCGYCLIKNLVNIGLKDFIVELSEFFPEVNEINDNSEN